MKTVNIVGAGLAGSILAANLRSEGIPVRIFDDKDSKAASLASSNLFITSWLKKFTSAQAGNGIKTLERLYPTAINKPFESGIGDAMKVRHIAQRDILVQPDVIGTIVAVDEDMCWCKFEGQHTAVGFEGLTVLCLGYRQQDELAPLPDLWVKVGHCIFVEGDLPPGKSRLAIVSPYTHEKLYQFAPGVIYYADSVAVKRDVYGKRGQELFERTHARMCKHLSNPKILSYKVGYRPFVPGHDFGYVAEVKKNVWAINGGGKNGMVAYADAATRVTAEIKARLS